MLDRVWAIATAVVADGFRRKLTYVALLFGVVMAAAIPALPSYGQGIVEAVFREVALALIYVVAMTITIALGATRLPSEIERRTIYPILARGMQRYEYLLGTWLGIVITMALMLTSLGAITVLIGWFVYDVFMWKLLGGVFAIWLESGVVAALCVAAATMAGPVIVSVIALAFLFVTHVRSMIFQPGTVAYVLYPSLDAFNVINTVAHGQGVTLAYAASMLAVWAGFSGVLLLLAVALFSRRDL